MPLGAPERVLEEKSLNAIGHQFVENCLVEDFIRVYLTLEWFSVIGERYRLARVDVYHS
jgi:hypothetical protein